MNAKMDTLNTPRLVERIRSLVKIGVHFCYSQLIEPRSKDEDIQRHEHILNTILVSLIALIGILDISILYNSITLGSAYSGISFFAFSAILALLVSLLVMSRLGWVRLTSYLLIAVYLSAITYSQYRWGMSLPSALLSDALLITISCILISARFAIGISVVISGIIIWLAYYESSLGIIPAWRHEPVALANGIQYAIILLATTVLAWLYWKDLEKSLARAKASEKALRDRNDSLEQIVEERTRDLKQAQVEKMSQLYRFVEFGRLSSGVFHDMMNPLSAITSNVESLQSSLHSDIPEIKEQLSRAISASKRIERFVETVKKQVQTQQITKAFMVNEEIEEAILLFEYKAKKNQIFIEFIAERMIVYTGNPLKFHQIVANLISNAIDAYDEIGPDCPEEKKKDRIVSIEIKKHEKNIILRVKDSGAGMAPEILPHIFDPFFTTKNEHRGIGLGLSTTKHLIEKDFNGTIEVKSVHGCGTEFIVSLPITSNETTNATNTI